MKFSLLIVGAVLALASLGAIGATTEIHCGYVLDVEAEKLLSDQRILVRDDRIIAMGPAVDTPAGAGKIDLSDRYCAPGLMDAHAHLFFDITRGTVDQTVPTQSSAYKALRGLKNAQILLRSGFTTIRIPGDGDLHYAGIDLRNAINRGDFVGPRMFVAPHAISALGGHGDLNTYAPDLVNKPLGFIADGVDEVRKAVRKEIKYGADWIKVMASGGVISQHDDPEVSTYSQAEFNAMAEEAHRHHKKITAHAHSDAAIRMAVEAGFDSIEHATLVSEKTIKLMAKKGTYYIPTLYVIDWIIEMGRKGGVSADNLEKAKLVAARHSRSVNMAYKHGVKMVLGTDPVFPMDQAIREFNAMATRIPNNWYVLQAGTIHGAELLGLAEETGSLKVGKLADIVAMEKNPIAAMKNIEQIGFVMKNGAVVRNDY
ncbi:metal-dependent hydrolase family protein [Exilibacterium tricleocarpae]|nr:amidohydrolase family protein [Exilibacterium tricleocarpae]